MTESVESTRLENLNSQAFDLAPGVQVRRESFGLLFYCRSGPRLFSLSSGPWLEEDFFWSDLSLAEWRRSGDRPLPPGPTFRGLLVAMEKLAQKGVLVIRDRSSQST